MDNLCKSPKDELSPEVPSEAGILGQKASKIVSTVRQWLIDEQTSKDGPNDRSSNTREYDEGHGVLLIVWFVQISRHAQCDRSSGCRNPTESSPSNHGTEVLRESTRQLPDVYQETRQLKDWPVYLLAWLLKGRLSTCQRPNSSL